MTLGLCSQIDLDFEVNRAAKERGPVPTERGPTLVPAEITTGPREVPQPDGPVFAEAPQPRSRDGEVDLASVFGTLKGAKPRG